MVEWLTLAAASIAAVGAVIGPVLSYRAAVRNGDVRRRQDDVDHYVRFCLSDDPAIRRMGINQLAFLLDTQGLTPTQANAAAEAMRAELRKAGEQVADHPSAETRADPTVADDPMLVEWDTRQESEA
jgi:hypothetical protein